MGLDSQKHVTSENQGYIYHLRQNFAGSRHRAQCLLEPEPCDGLTFFGENGKVRYSLNYRKFTRKFEILIYSLGKRV